MKCFVEGEDRLQAVLLPHGLLSAHTYKSHMLSQKDNLCDRSKHRLRKTP